VFVDRHGLKKQRSAGDLKAARHLLAPCAYAEDVVNNQATVATCLSAPVCRLDDIADGTARPFQVLRRKPSGRPGKWQIVLARKGDDAFGYVNVCPHEPVNLNWEGNDLLDPQGPHLRCAKHGARFELHSGLCVDGPCEGESLKPVALSVVDGAVCLHNVELVSP
jgi:nitrite reductase/ring-hydroxylating ferredoxin subunit